MSARAEDRSVGLAPTLSGFTSAPVSDRSARVPEAGVGIKLRAPASVSVATIHTYWRRATDRCRLALHDDADGAPGALLADAPLADGVAGWVGAPLSAALAVGHVYHAVASCEQASSARLGFVFDNDSSARNSGAWQLEELRGGRQRIRRRPATPLFALELTDGTWWGQPYRAIRGRPVVRVCWPDELSAVLVPRRPLVVSDVHLPPGTGGSGVSFTLDADNGTTILAGRPGDLFSFPALSAPATLAPGVPYTLRLRTAHPNRGCFKARALATDLPLGPPLAGLQLTRLALSDDAGHTWNDVPNVTVPLALIGSEAPLAGCGDGNLDADEQCDAGADAACPDRCTDTCTCRAPDPGDPGSPACGDGVLDAGEECDAGADALCPGRCTATCTCDTVAPPPGRTYRSIYTSGYLGVYDRATIPVWPERLGVVLGGPDIQGPMIEDAKRVAAAAGNTDARFVFYLNFTSLDSRCDCFESRFYQGIASAHPEWILRDGSGTRISTFTTQYGAGRLWAVDIGNMDFIDAWGDAVLGESARDGWDGVWADNILRGNFYDWSAWPTNPRTGSRYTTAEYRQDTLKALQRLRQRFDAQGKILIGNYGSVWEPDTLADPVVQQQIVAMHGIEIEDCVYTFGGQPHGETTWINQLKYLAFANRRGVLTQCRGGNGTIGDPTKRDYILASYLLTKEGFSNVAQLNDLEDWWPGLEVDLGAPRGGFACLDPAAGLASTQNCPSAGKIYVREWERGRVLVNPTPGVTATVQLGETMRRNGSAVSAVTLGPRSGAVLVRP